MPPFAQPVSKDRWAFYSWALIFVYTLFQALQWELLPRFLDIYYHLSVMEGFRDAGGYVTRAYWEYAPDGRPHLYPPLLHVWMWMLREAGLDPISVGRFVDCVSFPALLCAFYYTASRLAGTRTAFWALLLFSSSYPAVLASVTLSAYNIGFILALLALLEAERGRTPRAALLLGLCFYTHTLSALLAFLAFVLNAVSSREKRRAYLSAAIAGAAIGLPMLAHELRFRDHFGFVDVHENKEWELDLAVYALLAYGCTSWKSLWRTAGTRWAVCLLVSSAPLIATHQTRFFSGHGLVAASLLAALCGQELVARMSSRRLWPVLAAAALFVALVSPHLELDLKTKRLKTVWADRTLARALWLDDQRSLRSNAFTVYFERPYQELAGIILAHSDRDDILWSDFSYTAGILSLMTDRVTSCAMLAEIKPYTESDRLSDARILIWFRDKDGRPSEQMAASAQRRGLKLLAETEMAYVFENALPTPKRSVPKPLIPSVLFWPLGFGALASVLLTFLPNKK